ncbi:MAG: glycosyltransferase [Candidatus Roizmanbacteria bacterium]|nr:glycosyltransferase [Candidatus Roizmanbacteria bacterium]MCR4313045.1 glycosyltransferase [Candidatus Roizmanbacteria bacterium]
MKISVDGGALNLKSSQRFGTAVFSENLIRSLQLYDDQNIYHIYTFKNLKPKIFWMKGRVSLEEIKENKDIFLALNQALPLYTSGKIINFCHGLSYHFFPKYYPEKYRARLNRQLNEMIKRSDKIIVSSQKVKKEITSMYPDIEKKVVILPFGIPYDMLTHQIHKDKDRYFLFVANNQKIKNADFVVDSFIRSKLHDQGYKLYMIGDWKNHENIDKGIVSLGSVSRKKLSTLYQKATALLTSSYYESFNFPVLEALSQSCPVIGLKSAIIPELKSYVNVATNSQEFVDFMKKITKKPDVQSINRLYKNFNWKKYVKNLVKLY